MTEENLSCSDVRDAIEPILKQAQLSYDVNYAHVENFTQTAFNDNHQAHHNRWRTKHLPWLDPNGEPLQLDDYEKNLPEKAIQHLRLPGPPNREELTRELTNLYQRFEILARAFQVIKEHENETIAEYLKQQNEYVIRVLKETTDGMRKLHIKQPIVDVQIPEYKGVRELRDWIVTREHLKLLSYVQAYELLLQRCA